MDAEHHIKYQKWKRESVLLCRILPNLHVWNFQRAVETRSRSKILDEDRYYYRKEKSSLEIVTNWNMANVLVGNTSTTDVCVFT